MLSFLNELAEYNHHCNQLLTIEMVKFKNQVNEKSIKLMSHILNAQHIWMARIKSLAPQYNVWQVHEINALEEIEFHNYLEIKKCIQDENLNANIEYQNTKGERFENLKKDILFHVFNHSTYHRAQIATEFRNTGLEPIATDFIFYKR